MLQISGPGGTDLCDRKVGSISEGASDGGLCDLKLLVYAALR
jgi:hypothetical protein